MSDLAEPHARTEAMPANASLEIRPARADDLDAILEIERSSFQSPWPRSALADELKNRSWSKVVSAFRRGRLVGFMVYWTVIDELHLLNLAVAPRFRRCGVGTALVDHLIEAARTERRATVLLEVRASNRDARRIYDRFGFTAMGVRRGYYSDSGEDAVVMALDLRDVRSVGK